MSTRTPSPNHRPRVRRRHSRCALHEPTRPAQGQVPSTTCGPEGVIGRSIWHAPSDIRASEGWRGLYRSLGPNIAGNASSWGLHFLLYNKLKRRATDDTLDWPFSTPNIYSFPPNECCDGDSYEPDMGSQGPDVHRASQLPRSSPRALECILRDIPRRSGAPFRREKRRNTSSWDNEENDRLGI